MKLKNTKIIPALRTFSKVMTTDASYIESHYTNNNLFELIVQALEKNGIPQHQVTRAALAAVDEFHIRGQEVSLEMATLASLQPGMQVLDVGCGIGGACRLLADTFNCTVTGIDITAEYIRTAQLLSTLVGLQHNTRFVQGNALNLPFDDGFFDVIWTQHVQMNIADKTTLYTQISRVLKSTGRFIYYDVLRKSNQPIYYPVPWAGNHTLSHLINSQQLQQLLQQAGLQRIQVQDETPKAIAFLQKALPRMQTALPPVGLHLLMGPDAVEKLNNLYKSLTEGSLILECGLYSKDRLAN